MSDPVQATVDGGDLDLPAELDPEELELGELRSVTLRPGDRLVVMQEFELDRTARAVLAHRLAEFFPGHPLLFLPPGVTLGVVATDAPEDGDDRHDPAV